MPNNAGKGRQKGSRNKITEATLALAKSGESPLELMLRVTQDEEAALVLRLNAARWAAPYVHPKPYPAMPLAEFSLPETISSVEGLLEANGGILRSVSTGDLAPALARDLSAIVETHRRLMETTDLEMRLLKLEKDAKP